MKTNPPAKPIAPQNRRYKSGPFGSMLPVEHESIMTDHPQTPPPASLTALVKQLDAVPRVNICYCGRPEKEHTFWDDKMYDVQGRTCPGVIGGDYRFDAAQTARRHIEDRARALEAALLAAGGEDGSQGVPCVIPAPTKRYPSRLTVEGAPDAAPLIDKLAEDGSQGVDTGRVE